MMNDYGSLPCTVRKAEKIRIKESVEFRVVTEMTWGDG